MFAEDVVLSDRAVALESEFSMVGPELHVVVVRASHTSGNCPVYFLESNDLPVREIIRAAVKGALPRKLHQHFFVHQVCKSLVHEF
jgi:hypothetical protein